MTGGVVNDDSVMILCPVLISTLFGFAFCILHLDVLVVRDTVIIVTYSDLRLMTWRTSFVTLLAYASRTRKWDARRCRGGL